MTERWKASADEMEHRRRLANYLDSQLSREERETAIHFFGDSNRFEITTYSMPIVGALLKHGYAKIEWLYVLGPDEQAKRIDNPSTVEPAEDRARIEGIRATLPIGALSIKGSPRNDDRLSKTVNTPADAQSVREVFNESH